MSDGQLLCGLLLLVLVLLRQHVAWPMILLEQHRFLSTNKSFKSPLTTNTISLCICPIFFLFVFVFVFVQINTIIKTLVLCQISFAGVFVACL